MKKSKVITITVILLTIFFLFGAFFVNLPRGNYFFFIYDIGIIFLLWLVRKKFIIDNVCEECGELQIDCKCE